jgi:hypothetical protein
MALGSTQPLTEMSTGDLPGGKGRAAGSQPHRHLWASFLDKMWETRSLTTIWAATACYRDSFATHKSVSSGFHRALCACCWCTEADGVFFSYALSRCLQGVSYQLLKRVALVSVVTCILLKLCTHLRTENMLCLLVHLPLNTVPGELISLWLYKENDKLRD